MTIVFCLAGMLTVFTAICFWAYRFAFYSPDKTQNNDLSIADTPQMNAIHELAVELITDAAAIPYEPVFILSNDGLKLRGRYYHQKDGAPLNICFHGYRGTPARDFSGGLHLLLDMGNNVLMVEQRAQCGSEGHTITFGIKERQDCLSWINYAVERFGPEVRIIPVGISMGAATVLMAAGMDMPRQVLGIAADCPYTSPIEIITKVGGELHLPAWAVRPFSIAAAAIFGGFKLTEASAVEGVKNTKVPILLIHGEEDYFVPCEMSRRLHAANPEMTALHTFPGAGHGLSYIVDRPRYERLVKDFCAGILAEHEKAKGHKV